MKILSLLSAVVLGSTGIGLTWPDARPRANITSLACTGCAGSEGSFNTIPSCITFVVTGLDCESGSCTGAQNPCAKNPCKLHGEIALTNNCVGSLWLRFKKNGACEPGTTEIEPGGEWNIEYDGDDLACGTTLMGRIYTSDPGTTCPTSSAAGWHFTCTECTAPPD